MKMLKLVVGPLQTNCYILYEDGKCLIVDPGDEENNIIKQIEKLKLVPVAILLTHNHFDHTGAANSLSEFFRIPIYDYKNLFEEKKVIPPFTFRTIYTPGHSQSSVVYYFEDYNFMFGKNIEEMKKLVKYLKENMKVSNNLLSELLHISKSTITRYYKSSK